MFFLKESQTTTATTTTKNNPKKQTLANQIRDGARPKLRAVCYRLTWVTLCFCVKWDAKTRLQSPSESHVLQTAACFLLPSSPGRRHLCAWPRRRNVVHVRVEPPAESKTSAAWHWYGREGVTEGRDTRCQGRRGPALPNWRAFVWCANGNKTKILQIITRKTLRILFWKCCDPHCSNYCVLQPSELYFERADSLCEGFFVTKWGSEICFLGSSEVDGFNSVYKTAEDRPRKPT